MLSDLDNIFQCPRCYHEQWAKDCIIGRVDDTLCCRCQFCGSEFKTKGGADEKFRR